MPSTLPAAPAGYWPVHYWPEAGGVTLLYVPGPITVSEAGSGTPTAREVPRAETVSLSEVGGIVVSVREV